MLIDVLDKPGQIWHPRQVGVTLVHEMRRRGVDYAAATLCGGGGQGYAIVLRRPGLA